LKYTEDFILLTGSTALRFAAIEAPLAERTMRILSRISMPDGQQLSE
jgi:hypothetical protein